ncbi:MAG: hypothetical protein N2381_11075, partial [Armatimonadetes bacterium]|nr:hypothetical protein [Armatimonadota bacterium]
ESYIVVMWLSGAPPKEEFEPIFLDFILQNLRFVRPVLADLLTGEVYEIPKDRWSNDSNGANFVKVPIYDSPILLAESCAILAK